MPALDGPAAESEAVGLARTLSERAGVERQLGEDRAYVDALIRRMQADRLVWAPAPPEIGGLGCSTGDLARITFHLARTSGSLGLIYAMHASQALTLLRHGATPFLESLTGRLAAEQALVASGTSEKGLGGDIFTSLCTVEPAADGEFAVVKESPNISYLDHARVVLMTAMQPGARERKTQVLIASETARMQIEPGPDARLMGMRGILNRPYRLTARFGEAAVFREPYPAIARGTMTPAIHLLWAALWSGLASASLGKARDFLAGKGGKEEYLAAELSRLVDRHYALNALIRDAVLAFDHGPAGAMGLVETARAKRLKTQASALVQEICLGALALVGMPGYFESGPFSLSEIIRDALSAPVMISNHRLVLANAPVERFIEETP